MSYMSKTIQLLTARCGKIRPDSVADYIANGGFSALKKAMSMAPMEIDLVWRMESGTQ